MNGEKAKQKRKALTATVLETEQKELLKGVAGLRQKARLREEMKSLTIFLGLLGAAVAGRVAFQWVPSVEPIIPFAVLAGLLFGMKEGFTLGGSAYVISNFFVWGLQGPWTVFQAIGAAGAGLLGGFFGKIKKPTTKDIVVLSVIGTVFFEIVMNVSGPIMGIGLLGALGLFSIPLYFLTSLPFSLTHIVSNIFFAAAISPLLKLWRKKDEFKIVSYTRIAPDGKRSNVRMYKSEDSR
jgi:energy-coupling factor transport system substrate-specific component